MSSDRKWPGPAPHAAEAAGARLTDRYPTEPALRTPESIANAISTGDRPRAWQSPIIFLRDVRRTDPACTYQDVLDALAVSAQATLDQLRADRDLILMARKRGVSWAKIGDALGRREPKVYFRWLEAQLGPKPSFLEEEPNPT